jgi:hypothetical protein
MSSPTTISVSAIGFFSMLMLLTLNADNGRDVLDELVPWVASETAINEWMITEEVEDE